MGLAADRGGPRDPRPGRGQPRPVPDPGRDRVASARRPIDWRQVAALYAELAELTGSPVVRLNGAVAIAEADGPAAALAIVDRLDLAGYPYWHSTGPSCCADSGGPTRRGPPTKTRSPSRGPSRSAASCASESRNAERGEGPHSVLATAVADAVPPQVTSGGGADRGGERRELRRVQPPALPVQRDVDDVRRQADERASGQVGAGLRLGEHAPAKPDADGRVEVGG